MSQIAFSQIIWDLLASCYIRRAVSCLKILLLKVTGVRAAFFTNYAYNMVQQKCLDGKTADIKSKMNKTTSTISMFWIGNLIGYMMHQSSRGWCVSGSGEEKEERVGHFSTHPLLAVAGSWVGIEALRGVRNHEKAS